MARYGPDLARPAITSAPLTTGRRPVDQAAVT